MIKRYLLFRGETEGETAVICTYCAVAYLSLFRCFAKKKWLGVLFGRILPFPPQVFMVVPHKRSQVVELWRKNSNWRAVARKAMEIVVSFLGSQKTKNTEYSLVKPRFNFIFDTICWDFPSFSLSNCDFKSFPPSITRLKNKEFFFRFKDDRRFGVILYMGTNKIFYFHLHSKLKSLSNLHLL